MGSLKSNLQIQIQKTKQHQPSQKMTGDDGDPRMRLSFSTPSRPVVKQRRASPFHRPHAGSVLSKPNHEQFPAKRLFISILIGLACAAVLVYVGLQNINFFLEEPTEE